METATNTNSTQTGWLASLAKGEFPNVPVSLSMDATTIISLASIALIIVVIIFIFKR